MNYWLGKKEEKAEETSARELDKENEGSETG